MFVTINGGERLQGGNILLKTKITYKRNFCTTIF